MSLVGWSARSERSGPAVGAGGSPNRLIPSAAVVIRPGEGLAGHERSPVIAGCSPRMSCRIRRRVRRPEGRSGDQHELPGAAPAGPPVVHTVTSPGVAGTPTWTALPADLWWT